MNDQDDRSREQLLQEMAALRARVAELETSAEKLKQSDFPAEVAGEPYHWQGRRVMVGLFHDITEAALRDSEERLALTIAGAELGMWDYHVPGGRVVYNERWAEMLGYTLAEIKPHVSSWEKLVHPDDVTAVTASINAHLAGQTPFYQSEHRLLSKSGEWKWVLDTGKVFEWDDQGQPVRMVGIHQDITERKQMERIEAAQLAVSQILAGSPEPAAGLRQVLVSMAGRLDGQIAELWQCGHDGRLTWRDGWRAPDLPELAEFERASQGYTFRPGEGLPGAVWQAGQAMWDREVLLAPEHPRAPLVAAAGLLSATGVPITVDGDPVAVMIFFSQSDWPLDERLLVALTDLGRQIGQFLARKQAEADREGLIAELQAALTKVKQLEGILPICSFCKKIRDQDNQWHQLEDYISHHSEAEFSHTFCPSCGRKYYPDFFTDLPE